MRHVINVCAPGNLDPYDSYGQIGCELARHLSRQGAYVNALALGRRQVSSQDAEVASLTARPLLGAAGAVLLGYPTMYARMHPLARFGPQVAVTMFESSKIPPTWTEPLNVCDAVVVPSRFCADVFRACGVTSPVHVVPLGLNPVYVPYERESKEPFTFLSFLDRGERKGGLAAIQAFVRAFGDDMGYRLVLKARRHKGRPDLEFVNPNIEVVQEDMTPAELYALYCGCDCLVNPNKGEGFGLIPREYAATGGIALATNWGGTADDIDAWGWPLPYALEPADWQGIAKFDGLDLGEWAQPDIPGVAEMMRHVAQNRDQYRQEAMAKAESTRALYTWEKFARGVHEIWKEIADGHSHRTIPAQERRGRRRAHAA